MPGHHAHRHHFVIFNLGGQLVSRCENALSPGTPQGACDYIDADLHDPDAIVDAASETLDFTQPVALMLLGIVHHIIDTDDAYAIVDRLIEGLAPGSFLAINHATNVIHGTASDEAARLWNQLGTPPITLRSPTQIGRFFDGLWLVEPGIVSCSRWRPEATAWLPAKVDEFCGLARKPYET